MDFRTQVTAAGGASRINADALLLLLAGDAVPAGLDEALAGVATDAVRDGDLAFKPGKTLYLHRVAGVKAARVVLATVGAGGAKAVKAAALAGLGLLKSPGVKDRKSVV